MEQINLRDTASRACDGCRMRKVRCNFTQGDTGIETTKSCTRCRKLNLECAFLQPPMRRGRKKRQMQAGEVLANQDNDSDSIPPNNSPGVDCINTLLIQQERIDNLVYMHDAGYSLSTPAALSWPQESTLAETLTVQSPTSRPVPFKYVTDDLCSRSLLALILDDYLCLIYPLVPLIHRPSFIRDFYCARDTKDKDFHSLVVALAASLVSAVPRRFRFYRSQHDALRFTDRREMINYCFNTIMRNRGPDYFDQINHCKWAIAYSLRLAFYHVGEHNRSRMLDVESMQIARLLYFHKVSEYEGLNCIEAQLRKKAFWLVFYAYVHNQLQIIRKERLSYLDPDILASLKLQDLLPLDVDDEMISEESVEPQPSTKPCVTTCFIIHSRVFWAALRSCETAVANDQDACICSREKNSQIQIPYLKSRLRELKYMLDAIPPRLRQWATMNQQSNEYSSREARIVEAQFQTMRANLHSTQIWLQSILLDQLDALLTNEQNPETQDASLNDGLSIWREREELSRQLLHVLHSISHYDLEPNGLNLTEKIRDVAVGLLSCPHAPHDEPARRAAGYIKDFTEIMAKFEVDPVHTSNTQSWVDTDRPAASHYSPENSRNSTSPWI